MTGRKRLLVVGRSHVMCIRAAFAESDLSDACDLRFLVTSEYEPCFGGADGLQPSDALAARLEEERALGLDGVVLMIQGNQHSILSLIRSDPPLGFQLPDAGDGTWAEERTLIPVSMVRRWYRNCLRELDGFLAHFCDGPNLPVLVMGPPPPIRPGEEVRGRLDRFFTERHGQDVMVEDAGFRMDAWRLYDSVFREIVAEHGPSATFVGVDENMLEPGGFLAAPFWGTSATHANAAYGRARVGQALDRI